MQLHVIPKCPVVEITDYPCSELVLQTRYHALFSCLEQDRVLIWGAEAVLLVKYGFFNSVVATLEKAKELKYGYVAGRGAEKV